MENSIEKPAISILQAKAADTLGITQLLYKTWLATYPNERAGVTEDDIHDRFEKRLSTVELEARSQSIEHMPDGWHVFVAKNPSGDIVGMCRIHVEDTINKLQALYVDPMFQRQGIGSRLWNEALTYFNPDNDIELDVAVYNARAIGFYTTLGFVDTGERFLDERFKMKSGAMIPEMKMVLKR